MGEPPCAAYYLDYALAGQRRVAGRRSVLLRATQCGACEASWRRELKVVRIVMFLVNSLG
jgi:hypothetical protein